MSYITIGVIALTAIAILFGTLWGMGRGRNRSILRLILIIGCVAGAIFLRPIIVKVIMGIDTGEGTIAEMLASSMGGGESEMPEAFTNLLLALVEISFGLVSYFVAFFALRLVSWIIIFPICKIFVKKESKKKKGAGALIGFIQGLVIAFAVVVPLNGLTGTMAKLSQIEMQGKPLMEMPAEIGLEEHLSSPINGVYDTVGGWYFGMLTSSETADGTLTLNGVADVFGGMLGFINGMSEIGNGMSPLANPDKTSEERVVALRSASDALANAGAIIDGLDADSKDLFNKVLVSLKDMMGEESPEMADLFNGLTADKLNFTALAQGYDALADYIEYTKINVQTVTQEKVNDIINGLAGSNFFIQMLIGDGSHGGNPMYAVESEHATMFATAVNATTLTSAQQTALLQVFYIN